MKQTALQRVERIVKDLQEGKKEVNVRARWKNIAEDEDVPGIGELLAALGPMPEPTLDDVPRDVAVRYAARDADATQRIAPILAEKHSAMELDVVGEIDTAVVAICERMQTNGMPINVEHFRKLEIEMTAQMDAAIERCRVASGDYGPINPGSGDQVAALLFDYLKLPIRFMTDSGTRGSTNDKVLEGLRSVHPAVPPILDYRECAKIRDSFARTFPRIVSRDGRVRCTLRITRVYSGRLASSDPNLLAVPVHTENGRKVRAGFQAPVGREFGTCDLDQIEMRVMAHRSEDRALVKIFLDGVDIHTQTASKMFGIKPELVDKDKHRYPAKQVGFGIINGMTGRGLANQFALRNVEGYTEQDCDALIESWFGIYPGVKDYMRQKAEEARRYGFVRDMWGRIRYLPGIHSPDRWMQEEAARQAVNHDIQGSAQGILKLGMAEVWNETLPAIWREGIYCEPLLQVHDELLFEMEEGAGDAVMPMVQSALTGVVKLKVPVKAKWEIGRTWGELK